MRTDLYTRVVLTGIFFCLVWLCVIFTPIGSPVTAQGNVQDVRIVGIKHPGYEEERRLGRPISRKLLGDWDSLPVAQQ